MRGHGHNSKHRALPVFSKIFSPIISDGENVVKTQNIPTKAYFSSVNAYFGKSTINVILTPDPAFTRYDTPLIEFKNLTNPTWGARGIGYDRTTGSEINKMGGIQSFNVVKSETDQLFELRIYQITTDLEKIALPDTVVETDPERKIQLTII